MMTFRAQFPDARRHKRRLNQWRDSVIILGRAALKNHSPYSKRIRPGRFNDGPAHASTPEWVDAEGTILPA